MRVVMKTSLFELFKIGIGPSSSHTVGPMRAAKRFINELASTPNFPGFEAISITVDLFGSLALTGIGHATDRAILLGLSGESPDTVETPTDASIEAARASGELNVFGSHRMPFREAEHLRFHRDQLYPDPANPTHPNGMKFTARDNTGATILETIFYSV